MYICVCVCVYIYIYIEWERGTLVFCSAPPPYLA